MKTIVFASNNSHKLEEIRAVLEGKFQLLSLAEAGFSGDIPETGDTLRHNAIEKAEYIHARLGVSVFADDSGLEVTALGGMPGVDTAHYSGSRDAEANMDLLLKNLATADDRSARFVTVIAYIEVENSICFEGMVEGEIAIEKQGKGGFGYDPIFLPEGQDRSFAEMSAEEKSAISHRARAMAQFKAYLENPSSK